MKSILDIRPKSLPLLYGSEAQTAWASGIRSGFLLDQMLWLKKEHLDSGDNSDEAIIAVRDAIVQDISRSVYKSARYWIDMEQNGFLKGEKLDAWRYDRVQRALPELHLPALPNIDELLEKKKLVIFELENVLVRSASGAYYRDAGEEWEWCDGVEDVFRSLRSRDIAYTFAANEGGVAFGMVDEAEMEASLESIARYGEMITYAVCYTHPGALTNSVYKNKSDNRRKPNPGMISELMHNYHVSKDETLLVGEYYEDMLLSDTHGIDFIHAYKMFEHLSEL